MTTSIKEDKIDYVVSQIINHYSKTDKILLFIIENYFDLSFLNQKYHEQDFFIVKCINYQNTEYLKILLKYDKINLTKTKAFQLICKKSELYMDKNIIKIICNIMGYDIILKELIKAKNLNEILYYQPYIIIYLISKYGENIEKILMKNIIMML